MWWWKAYLIYVKLHKADIQWQAFVYIYISKGQNRRKRDRNETKTKTVSVNRKISTSVFQRKRKLNPSKFALKIIEHILNFQLIVLIYSWPPLPPRPISSLPCIFAIISALAVKRVLQHPPSPPLVILYMSRDLDPWLLLVLVFIFRIHFFHRIYVLLDNSLCIFQSQSPGNGIWAN